MHCSASVLPSSIITLDPVHHSVHRWTQVRVAVKLPGDRLCQVRATALLWLWASESLLYLKALQVLGLENRGVNLISRGCLLPDGGPPNPWRWADLTLSLKGARGICSPPDKPLTAHYSFRWQDEPLSMSEAVST